MFMTTFSYSSKATVLPRVGRARIAAGGTPVSHWAPATGGAFSFDMMVVVFEKLNCRSGCQYATVLH